MLEALHGKVVGLDKTSTLPLVMPALAPTDEEYRAYRDPMAAGLREEDMEYKGERGFIFGSKRGSAGKTGSTTEHGYSKSYGKRFTSRSCNKAKPGPS